jgi:hypothetical protein
LFEIEILFFSIIQAEAKKVDCVATKLNNKKVIWYELLISKRINDAGNIE